MVTDINNRIAVNPQASPLQAASAASDVSKGVQKQPSPVTHTETQETKTETHVDQDQLLSTVEEINEHAEVVSHNIQFKVDESSGLTVVQVVDRDTNEVLRQIPTEELLAIAQHLRETNDFNSTGFMQQA